MSLGLDLSFLVSSISDLSSFSGISLSLTSSLGLDLSFLVFLSFSSCNLSSLFSFFDISISSSSDCLGLFSSGDLTSGSKSLSDKSFKLSLSIIFLPFLTNLSFNLS